MLQLLITNCCIDCFLALLTQYSTVSLLLVTIQHDITFTAIKPPQLWWCYFTVYCYTVHKVPFRFNM